MSSQRDAYGLPIDSNRVYGERYGLNAMNEGGGFLESRGQGYAENMGMERNPGRQGRQTENTTDHGLESQGYGPDNRDDDMYGIGIGGGDRHHTPGDTEGIPGVDSTRQEDDLYERNSGTGLHQHQKGNQKQEPEHQQKGDSMLGKLMEKTGEVLGNENLEEHGREKRGPRIYRDRD